MYLSAKATFMENRVLDNNCKKYLLYRKTQSTKSSLPNSSTELQILGRSLKNLWVRREKSLHPFKITFCSCSTYFSNGLDPTGWQQQLWILCIQQGEINCVMLTSDLTQVL